MSILIIIKFALSTLELKFFTFTTVKGVQANFRPADYNMYLIHYLNWFGRVVYISWIYIVIDNSTLLFTSHNPQSRPYVLHLYYFLHSKVDALTQLPTQFLVIVHLLSGCLHEKMKKGGYPAYMKKIVFPWYFVSMYSPYPGQSGSALWLKWLGS